MSFYSVIILLLFKFSFSETDFLWGAVLCIPVDRLCKMRSPLPRESPSPTLVPGSQDSSLSFCESHIRGARTRGTSELGSFPSSACLWDTSRLCRLSMCFLSHCWVVLPVDGCARALSSPPPLKELWSASSLGEVINIIVLSILLQTILFGVFFL